MPDWKCLDCKIPIKEPPPVATLLDFCCDCCASICRSVETPWFQRWHQESTKEWLQQVLAKKRLIEGVL
jgi:hypothetical protein